MRPLELLTKFYWWLHVSHNFDFFEIITEGCIVLLVPDQMYGYFSQKVDKMTLNEGFVDKLSTKQLKC